MGGMTDTGELRFTKGHGTENDFVLVPDLDGTRDVTAGQVRRLTNRRAGIGGDGVIRVVPTRVADEQQVRDQGAQARWFMDYRNADGSVAEMCGNGSRVFAAYLRREGLETADELAIATRGGVRLVRFEGDLIEPAGAEEFPSMHGSVGLRMQSRQHGLRGRDLANAKRWFSG